MPSNSNRVIQMRYLTDKDYREVYGTTFQKTLDHIQGLLERKPIVVPHRDPDITRAQQWCVARNVLFNKNDYVNKYVSNYWHLGFYMDELSWYFKQPIVQRQVLWLVNACVRPQHLMQLKNHFDKAVVDDLIVFVHGWENYCLTTFSAEFQTTLLIYQYVQWHKTIKYCKPTEIMTAYQYFTHAVIYMTEAHPIIRDLMGYALEQYQQV